MSPDRYEEVTECSLYKHDRPSFLIESHHVVPKSWFVDVPVITPVVNVCPTCHYNIHVMIDDFVAIGRLSPRIKAPPPRQLILAHQAMEMAREKGLTPKGTL